MFLESSVRCPVLLYVMVKGLPIGPPSPVSRGGGHGMFCIIGTGHDIIPLWCMKACWPVPLSVGSGSIGDWPPCMKPTWMGMHIMPGGSIPGTPGPIMPGKRYMGCWGGAFPPLRSLVLALLGSVDSSCEESAPSKGCWDGDLPALRLLVLELLGLLDGGGELGMETVSGVEEPVAQRRYDDTMSVEVSSGVWPASWG